MKELSYQQIDEIEEMTGVDITDDDTKKGVKIAAADYYLRHKRGDNDLPDFETFYRTPRLGSAKDRPADPTQLAPAPSGASTG